jgi:hypothetical protein
VRIGVLFISYLPPGLPLKPCSDPSMIFLGFIRFITELNLKKSFLAYYFYYAIIFFPHHTEILSDIIFHLI